MKTLVQLCGMSFILANLALQSAERPPYYFRVDGGGMIQNDVDVKSAPGGKIKMDPGVRFDVAVGYHFTDWFALEGEVGVLYNNIDRITNPTLQLGPNPAPDDLNFYQVPILINGVYTLTAHPRLRPYAGVGVGGMVSILEAWQEGWLWDYRIQEKDFTFAYQGMAGIDYAVNDQIKIGIAYKFLGSLEHDFGSIETKETYSHSFLAAFTFSY